VIEISRRDRQRSGHRKNPGRESGSPERPIALSPPWTPPRPTPSPSWVSPTPRRPRFKGDRHRRCGERPEVDRRSARSHGPVRSEPPDRAQEHAHRHRVLRVASEPDAPDARADARSL